MAGRGSVVLYVHRVVGGVLHGVGVGFVSRRRCGFVHVHGDSGGVGDGTWFWFCIYMRRTRGGGVRVV